MDPFRTNKNPWRIYETEVPHRRFCDAVDGVSPAEKLSPEHLKLLRNSFSCLEESRRSRGGGGAGMRLEEFQQVLRSVIGPEVEDTWMERFFREVDVCCTGQVTWQQVSCFLLMEFTERERSSIPRSAVLESEPLIRHCYHNQREATVRVVAVSHPAPTRYISVSKGGHISVWNSSFHILRTVGLAGDPTEDVANTRRFRGWTTDAVAMGDLHRVAIATDCRDLHFINVSSGNVFEEIHLFGLRSVPTALCYHNDAEVSEQPPLLLLGDEKGGIHLMWFLNPMKGLFNIPTKKEKGPQRIFFPDLADHRSMISHRYLSNLHQEPVTRTMFESRNNVVMSSSESDETSVVFIKVSEKQETYTWRFKQGAKCFDYNSDLQLLVTGSCDRVVRLWNRFVTSSPVVTLLGHRTAVLDVRIYQEAAQILSYSRDADLRVWDISSHRCLRSVSLPFPCLQPGQIPDHGNFPFLLLNQTRPRLVVGCKDYLAVLDLAGPGRAGSAGPAASCVLFNPDLGQVVTGHEDSSVCLWDVETGRRRLQICNAHGEDGVSCMSLDSSSRRLITGGRNGSVKVWSLLNGLNLHKLEPVTNTAVTAVTCLHDNQVLAVGRNQRIAQYDIRPTGAKDLYVRANMWLKSSGVHRSDVLALSQCSSLGVVATATNDGEVIVWRLETQGPLLQLQKHTQAGAAPPVDGLLFLQHRAGNRKFRTRGVLVSSQDGRLCFWSITGQSYGQFYAPEQPGERVLSLSSDQHKNTILVSGDTTGWIQVWDISGYGLDVQHQPGCERPPLLQSWKAHTRAVVSVETLEVADRLLVLTVSADGSAGLWTNDGDHVGYFGQEVMWNISNPATYQRENQMKLSETTESHEAGSREIQNEAPDSSGWSQTSQEEHCPEAFSFIHHHSRE